MALRYDTIRLDASQIRKDARGFVRVPAIIAKPGVYNYTEPGGKTVREYLPPEEVARADSLASVADAPVTRRHPANMVDPSTWASVSIGHASGPATATPEGARAELVIARADAQLDIGRELKEVSRGVQVRIDETPGVTPDGQAYDRVQRDIVYNHIALGPSGWGRQGAGVSLRLDSNGDEITDQQTMKYTDKAGKVHEFKTDAELQEFVSKLDAAPPFPPKKKGEACCDDDEEMTKAKKDAADEKARADAAEAQLAKIRQDEAAKARIELETTARKVLGAETKFDAQDAAGKPVPMTDRAVRELVIKRLDSAADLAGRDDAYVCAYMDLAIKNAKPSRNDGASALASLHGVKVDGTQTREDSAPAVTPDVKMRQDAGEAWKKNKGAAFSVK